MATKKKAKAEVTTTGAKGRKAASSNGKAAKARTRATTRADKAKDAPDLEVLRRTVTDAQALVDTADKEAEQFQTEAREVVAEAKAAYRDALAPYRTACRTAGVACEFGGGRAVNVSDRVTFLVEKTDKGLRVTVVSTVRSQPSMVADELRRQADRFVDIVELQENIERTLPADHPRARAREALPEQGSDEFDENDEDEDYFEAESA